MARFAALASIAAFAMLATTGQGATPASATMSVSSAPVSFTGTASGTGAANGEGSCTEGVSCDTFTITTTGTPADWVAADKRIEIRLPSPTPSDDYDFFIHKGNNTGTIVDRSAGLPGATELAYITPSRDGVGVYSIRVVYSTTTPSVQYQATATVVSLSPTPVAAATPDSGPKVGYEIFEAPGVFTTTVQSNGNTTEYLGRGAGEPSIGVNWKTATAASPGGVTNFQSDLQTIFATFNDGCPAGGKKATWTNRPAPTSQGVDSDPIGFTDRSTGRTFAGELTLLSPTCKISYTEDDGVTWVATSGPNGAAVDHQTIGGGPYHLIQGVRPPDAKPAPAYDQALYYCSQDLEAAYCMRSDDGGVSWQQSGTPNFTPANCGSYLHGHVKVAPTDGTVYLPNKSCDGIGSAAISQDNGATWTVSKVRTSATSSGTSAGDPAVGIDKSGRAYFAIATADSFLTVATSVDNGASWQNFADVTSALGLKNIRFPAAIGGDAGRAAVAFFGSTTPGNPSGSGFVGTWHLYIAHTFDAGVSWSVSDATPDFGMQRGCIWGGGGATICRNMLDFIGVTIDKQGRVAYKVVNAIPDARDLDEYRAVLAGL